MMCNVTDLDLPSSSTSEARRAIAGPSAGYVAPSPAPSSFWSLPLGPLLHGSAIKRDRIDIGVNFCRKICDMNLQGPETRTY